MLRNATQNLCPAASALRTSTTRLTLSQNIPNREGEFTFSQEGRKELEARALFAALMPNSSMPASRILLDISANNSFPNRKTHEEIKLALPRFGCQAPTVLCYSRYFTGHTGRRVNQC